MEFSNIIIYSGIAIAIAMIILFVMGMLRLKRKKQDIDNFLTTDQMQQIIKAREKKVKKVSVKADKIIKEEPDSRTRDFDAVRARKSKFSTRFWMDHIKDKYFPARSALINMELSNGMHKQFIVLLKPDGTFKYKGKMYLTDNEAKYYVIDSKLWCFDFHENFSLPIKRKIPVATIKKSIEASGISQVEHMTNPITLQRFAISKIAEGIMKGQQLDEFLKRLQLMTIIIMVGVLAHLALFMIKTGMLQSIKIPGIN